MVLIPCRARSRARARTHTHKHTHTHTHTHKHTHTTHTQHTHQRALAITAQRICSAHAHAHACRNAPRNETQTRIGMVRTFPRCVGRRRMSHALASRSIGRLCAHTLNQTMHVQRGDPTCSAQRHSHAARHAASNRVPAGGRGLARWRSPPRLDQHRGCRAGGRVWTGSLLSSCGGTCREQLQEEDVQDGALATAGDPAFTPGVRPRQARRRSQPRLPE